MAGPTWLFVDEAAVRAFIQPGGAVYDLIWDVSRDNREASRQILLSGGHYRSGRLERSLYANRPKMDGPLTNVSRVGASAAHALYAEEDTHGSTGSPTMLVPTNRKQPHASSRTAGAGTEMFLASGGKGSNEERGYFHAKTVQGYKGIRYLQRGLDAALAGQRLK